MKPASAVVLTIDRLGAAWLGPYGNTWVDTPQCCRLAAESVMCETVLADSPDLAQACAAWWTGRHVLSRGAEGDQQPLTALARQAGAESLLITDDSTIAAHPLAASFARQIVLPQPAAETAADEPGQTGLFRLIDAAIAALAEVHGPSLVWIHSRGMAGPWDAPRPLRQQFADEEDPAPPEFVSPPERMLAEGYDPDELLGLVHAYAGQVALADMAVGALVDAIDEHPHLRDAVLAVTSPRGYPLGEHRRVGPCDEALYGELLHVPFFLRLPGGQGALVRSQQILQPHDLYAAIARAAGWQAAESSLLEEIEGTLATPRQVAISLGPQQRAIRTPAWLLREVRASGDEEPQYELFAKPDDRCEVNEVASRCQDVVELLTEQLDRLDLTASTPRPIGSEPLPERLTEIWR